MAFIDAVRVPRAESAPGDVALARVDELPKGAVVSEAGIRPASGIGSGVEAFSVRSDSGNGGGTLRIAGRTGGSDAPELDEA